MTQSNPPWPNPNFASNSRTSPSAEQMILVFDQSPQHLTVQHSGWWESFSRRSIALYASSLNVAPSQLNVQFYVVQAVPPTTLDDLLKYARWLEETWFCEDLLFNIESAQCWKRVKGSEQGKGKKIGLTTKCFGKIDGWSAEKDAIELIVFTPHNQNVNVDDDERFGVDVEMVGAGLIIPFALHLNSNPQKIQQAYNFKSGKPNPFIPQNLNNTPPARGNRNEKCNDLNNAIIVDRLGIARRFWGEVEVRAHHIRDWAPLAKIGWTRQTTVKAELGFNQERSIDGCKRCTCEWHSKSSSLINLPTGWIWDERGD
ncbi:uncharacterized protein MEPE_00695 [Melanopsichium pennsylvanicum]|uniref:Uncharacterized protein n=1 Tax=Melanopsichium pennsylvanicum TaxID=63383 RepID=A0AAJ5C2W7_9BASI|nr:uncharacterized protein MEPE_00695 [Melanopsichium pennsylvanicum]